MTIKDIKDYIKEKLAILPEEPGVYLMYDKNRTIIYVGKALVLKNRIKSYFSSSILDNKTTHLVANIADFEYIITNSEQEAFILEANLIKQHQPRYNIIMKDDKKYPFIKININEHFPSIEITRDIVKDGSLYYGPYTDVRYLRKLLRDIEWIFPHKTCKKNIIVHPVKNERGDSIFAPPLMHERGGEGGANSELRTPNSELKRACLNHQLKKCPAPCIGQISKADYTRLINKITKFLLGKDDEIIKEMKAEMDEYAENLEFEKAARLRDQMTYIDAIKQKQHVYFNDFQDRDIIAFYKEEKHIAVTILKMKSGKISHKEVFSFKNYADETPEAVLRAFLLQYYTPISVPPMQNEGDGTIYAPPMKNEGGGNSEFRTQNSEFQIPYQILLQIAPDDFDSLNILFKKRLVVPARGEYKQLIEICRKNAFDYIESLKLSHIRKSTRTIIPIQQLKENLGLKKLPRKIVCIDVSTIQGSETVSSLVFFENGKPLKKQYRHFIIKTVQGQDDFASIAETLDRYLNRLIVFDNNNVWDIPDLIIIDGGKGQLSSALKIFTRFVESISNRFVESISNRHSVESISNRHSVESIPNRQETIKIQSIEIISIAKRIEEVFLPEQSESIIIPKTSSALKLITQIRDEAHRFAITHHRKRRSNRTLSSKLDDVKGLGNDLKFLLLKEFGSVENIKNTDKFTLMKIKGIGEKLSQNILDTLR